MRPSLPPALHPSFPSSLLVAPRRSDMLGCSIHDDQAAVSHLAVMNHRAEIPVEWGAREGGREGGRMRRDALFTTTLGCRLPFSCDEQR